MQNPHITLHIAKHLLLASGQLIERVWHRQTRLDETNKTCREGSPLVTAVANTSPERVPSLSASPFAPQANLRIRMHADPPEEQTPG